MADYSLLFGEAIAVASSCPRARAALETAHLHFVARRNALALRAASVAVTLFAHPALRQLEHRLRDVLTTQGYAISPPSDRTAFIKVMSSVFPGGMSKKDIHAILIVRISVNLPMLCFAKECDDILLSYRKLFGGKPDAFLSNSQEAALKRGRVRPRRHRRPWKADPIRENPCKISSTFGPIGSCSEPEKERVLLGGLDLHRCP